MESVVTITAPPSRSASAIASADLPLPVGPAISSTRAFFSLSRAFCMTHLCTLIADRTTRILTPAVRDKAAEVLGSDVTISELSDHAAYDIAFAWDGGQAIDTVKEKIQQALDPLPIDVAILPAEGRRKKLFLADMDSTMIEQECIDELADQLGIKAHIAAITERAMRGEIDFEPALRERVSMLKGLAESVIDTVLAERITLTPGGKELLATMRAHGTTCVLVSGGFTHFTSKVAETLGFSANHANQLLVEDGMLTGTVAEPIQGREAKKAHLDAYAQKLGLAMDQTMAIGDGANDLGMIEAAGLGVAFHAKPAVVARADAALTHTDLTGALYLQGYRDDEIAW
jgi:phosphoserine phosphatase